MSTYIRDNPAPVSFEGFEAMADRINKNSEAQNNEASQTTTTTVGEDQTLSAVAAEAGISLDELYRLNPQFDPNKADGNVDSQRKGNSGWDPDFIRPGDVIVLPPKTDSGAGSASGAEGGGSGSGAEGGGGVDGSEGGGVTNSEPEVILLGTNAAQGPQPEAQDHASNDPGPIYG